MKTVLLSIFALALAHLSYAQVNKGAFLIGTDFSFSHYDNSSERLNPQVFKSSENSLTLTPTIGYFTSNSFMVGLGLSYRFTGSENEYVSDNNKTYNKDVTHFFLFNPYVKKYLAISDKFYFTLSAGASVGIGNSNHENEENTSTRQSDKFSAGVNVSPGLTYFLNPKWALNSNFGSLFYSYNETESYYENSPESTAINKSNNFGASFSLNTFSLGVQYYLRND